MKTMTYLDIILWIQDNVFEIYENLNKQCVIEYYLPVGKPIKQKADTLLLCVLQANNAELNLEKSLDLTPRTPEEQIKAKAYVESLKHLGDNNGNNK